MSTIPKVFFISGKRYSGKTSISILLKKYYESLQFSVKILSISYFCKKLYCEIYNVDLNKMLFDHEYKDSHRDKLTEYFLTMDSMIFTKLLEDDIDKKKYNIYIVDDMRLKNEHADYFKQNCSDKWNIKYIRINSTDENKIKRGWKKTNYDDLKLETDLDDYNFDIVIDNDDSMFDLELFINNFILL
jgi:phosphomevalonate kinase